jgi:pimeloyl-ACP methyl ester carboxylesterase
MGRLTVKGTRLHYEDFGGSGEPVVFLHGFLFDGRQCEQPIQRLRDTYRCITIDFPGQGRSEPSRHGYGIDTLAADMGEAVEQLGVGPVHLAGLSMGGFAGMRLAGNRPQLLRSLTLINTSAAAHPRSKFPKQLALAVIARFTGVSLPPIVEGVESEMYGAEFRADPAGEPIRKVWRERWREADRGALVATLLGFMLRSDFRSRLAAIKVPTLVVAGAQDASLAPAPSREIARLMPDATLVELAHAGHSAPIEDPAGFTAALTGFLTRVAERP